MRASRFNWPLALLVVHAIGVIVAIVLSVREDPWRGDVFRALAFYLVCGFVLYAAGRVIVWRLALTRRPASFSVSI